MITLLVIRGVEMNTKNHKNKENEKPKDILEQVKVLLGK